MIPPWLAFLAHNQDSWVFQDQTVVEIIDEIFNDYAGQGTLQPQWRWSLADSAVYPRRSLSIQYNESDLAYVHRLLREEGLFYWWEHSAGEDGQGGGEEGSHTLVIADHNGAFQPNAQAQVRFTQSGASLSGLEACMSPHPIFLFIDEAPPYPTIVPWCIPSWWCMSWRVTRTLNSRA